MSSASGTQPPSPATRGQAHSVDILEVLQLIDQGLSLEEHARVTLFLDDFLPNCNGPLLEELLKLAPDEPIGPCERKILVQKRGAGWVVGEAKKWPKSVFALREKFPGYQPGYRFREDMKYGNQPPEDAPLSEWVAKLINHAKAKWAGEIGGRKTRLQFKEWLLYYLENAALCWTGYPGLVTAREILKVACNYPGSLRREGQDNEPV
jgi:hypothetical protein